jgi:hypothetical protein
MAVFLITLHSADATETTAMEKAIQQYYPGDYIKIGDLAWLVEDKNAITPQDVDTKLGGGNSVISNTLGLHLVSSFNGYWGYHDKSLWQWLQSRGL